MAATQATPDDAPRRRTPRRRVVVAMLVLAALVALLLAGRHAAQPDRIAALLLRQAGNALGLEITARGATTLRLRGVPQVVLRDVVARQPGGATPLLTAERMLVAVPWSTLRARGADLTVQRVELDAPVLDLAALGRWQASRPPTTAPRIPTLTDGVAVQRGRIDGSGWALRNITLDLPALHPARPVAGRLRATFTNASVQVPMDLRVALARPATDAGLGAVGRATVVGRDWRLQLDDLRMSGRLRSNAPAGLDRLRLGAWATLAMGDASHRFALGTAGRLAFGEVLTLAPLGLSVRGRDAVPTLDARGRLGLAGALALDLDGRLAAWPQAWPALPPPIGQSASPLPFVLAYRGPTDLSGDTRLQLRRDATRFDARFRLPRVLAWVDALATGTPLPPLDGTLSTPRLEIAGATLEGVDVTFDDGADD